MFNSLNMISSVHETFVGLWPLVWKFGATGAAIAGLLAAYFLMPAPIAALFPNLRKFLPWTAGILAVSLVSYAVGVSDEHKRGLAQQATAVKMAFEAGDQAREDAVAQVRKELAAEQAAAAPVAQPSTGPVHKPWITAPKRVRKPAAHDPYNLYTK